MTPQERLARINAELSADDQVPQLDTLGIPEAALAEAAATPKKYRLLAEGDSWFDYPLGKDVLDYLNKFFKHPITKLARAGSTLNELVYGPDKLFKTDPSQGKTRLTKVVEKLRQQRFDALLFSGGGNDIAGPEFFSFVNHAASELPNPNQSVLDGVVNGTFRKAYEDMIEVLLTESQNQGVHLPIFVHGYDYPWPDGRGAIALGIVGPWFEDSFRKKGFPLLSGDGPDLEQRRAIVAAFIKAVNDMLDGLQTKYAGKVFKVDLLGTLPNRSDWTDELHPTNAGFAAVALKFNNKLYEVLQ
jgi:lysophospholipase L1-like esterase